jgi:beta-glucosidase/6-phospho-beta-glucosidase/beta-galactosidase
MGIFDRFIKKEEPKAKNDQGKRFKKKSFLWYQGVIKTNGASLWQD